MDMSVMSAVELAAEMGSRVRDERLRRNLTQRTLAERAGVSRLTVTRLESGTPVTTVNFLAVLVALNRGGDLDGVLRPPRAQTMEQFVDAAQPTRQRGRR